MTTEELLDTIPDHIDYPIIEHIWEGGEMIPRWTEYKYQYKLRIEKTEEGKFLAFYVYTGFEGAEQILPLQDSEFQEILEYGCVLERVDMSKPTLLEALEELLCWLRTVRNVSKERTTEMV